MEWRSERGIEWLEARLPGARAAFSTRIGGVSEPPYSSLNLGYLTGDQRSAVVDNRRRLASVLGLDPGRVLIGRQVHGAELAIHLEAQSPSPFESPGTPVAEVDGQATTAAGLAPLVFTADCLPVALAGPAGVAMLHCGWRGLAAGILARGVEAVAATDVAIGPGIGPCCYEVGGEVRETFAALGIDVPGSTLDLTATARRLLGDAGVGRVEAAELCTSCEEDRFFSHRRDDGRTGRQAGLVWIESD
jgi:purine-nucleoside/S-methyl-5'-thioadenosine phosphorylase / adenosine deaminase